MNLRFDILTDFIKAILGVIGAKCHGFLIYLLDTFPWETLVRVRVGEALYVATIDADLYSAAENSHWNHYQAILFFIFECLYKKTKGGLNYCGQLA